MTSRMRSLAVLLAAVAVSALILAGCGPSRWCEEDATDTRKPDSYCEAGLPGYEWEPDHKKRVSTSKPKPTTTKPTIRR